MSTAYRNDPETWAFLAVGECMLDAMRTPEFQETREPMIVWRRVWARIDEEKDQERCARLIQAVSECIKSELQPGRKKA